MKVDTAVILAGGFGTRLRSIISEVPKPMAPINGTPFLGRLLDFWIKQGIKHFILSVGYKHNVITSHFGRSYNGATIKYVVEQTPLGTGGALLIALEQEKIKSLFLLINGDTFFDVSLERLVNFHIRRSADLTMAIFRLNQAESRYMPITINGDGRIISLGTYGKNQELYANGGTYLINPEVIGCLKLKAKLPTSLELDLMPILIKNGADIYGNIENSYFIDIGIPSDYCAAQNYFIENEINNSKK